MQFPRRQCFIAFIAVTATSSVAHSSDLGAPRLVSEQVSEISSVRADQTEDDVEISGADGALNAEALVAEVLARNAGIERAAEQLQAAKQRPAQERALADPMFTYMLGPGSLRRDDIDTAQKFEISQGFPWPGKRRLRAQAAEFDAESLRGDLDSLHEQLAHQARVAFVERWYADRSITVYGENLRLLEEFEEIAQDKYAAGIVSKQDALQATVERELLNNQVQVARRNRNRVEARINSLLDRSTDAPLPPSPLDLEQPMPLPSLGELRAAAERQRAELAASTALIRAAQSRAALARKEYYPDFEVMVGYDSFWGEDELRPSIGFSINVPVQRVRRRAAVAEAGASLSGAEAHARRVYRDIMLEVDEAYEWVHEALDAIALYETRLLPVADENLEAARSGYAAGEVDFLALISAQKLLIDTKLRAYEARADYHMSRATLARAVGTSLAGAPFEME